MTIEEQIAFRAGWLARHTHGTLEPLTEMQSLGEDEKRFDLGKLRTQELRRENPSKSE